MLPHPFDDELSDTFANLHLEIYIAEVEEQDLQGSSVVCINDASTDIDAVFASEAASRCNSAVGIRWNRNADICVGQHFPSSRDSRSS